MSAGSEFALRIALCDLVERLKRSEQMCKYLERCRNELAKELIRVKQENHVISKENSMLAASLEHNLGPQVTPRIKSPKPIVPVPVTVPPTASGDDVVANGQELLDKSTDWEEITARLLQQLRKEVELQMVQSGSSIVSTIMEGEDQRNKSVGSVFVPVAGRNASVKEEKTAMMKVRVEGEDGSSVPHPSSSSLHDSKFGRNPLEVVPGRGGDGDPSRRNSSGMTERTDGGGEEGKENEGSGVGGGGMEVVYVKMIRDLTSDLNKYAEQVAAQNEKLKRIKSKQLRCYFKRHLLNPGETTNSSNSDRMNQRLTSAGERGGGRTTGLELV